MLSRVEAPLAELEALRQRILDFQTSHAAALAGQTDLALYTSDPRRLAVASAS